MGTCTCKTGWTGPGCGDLMCPLDCSGNGKCIKGKCLCNEKWMGPGCENYKCPITNGFMCSNHGTCNNGTCDCDTITEGNVILGGYYGDQTCHMPYCGVHSKSIEKSQLKFDSKNKFVVKKQGENASDTEEKAPEVPK